MSSLPRLKIKKQRDEKAMHFVFSSYFCINNISRPHTMHFLKYILPTFLFLSITSACDNNEGATSLGENEYYLGERLASLSMDADSTFWIGGETGRIWHVEGDEVRSFATHNDRIYKVATRQTDNGDTVCWLGVRNSGLQRWRLHNGEMTHERTYDILFKQNRYSAYDFLLTPRGIFTATSQGLYLLNAGEKMQLLYPSTRSETARKGVPFVVYNLCLFNQRYLFAASIEGLLRVDLTNGAVKMMHGGENITYVTVYDKRIYALTDRAMYVEDADGQNSEKIELPFTPRLYYRVGTVHYMLRSHSMAVSEDLKTFLTIPLRREVPLSSHNVMLPDLRSGFTMLLTDNAFWRIPFHSDYFHNKGLIVLACTNGTQAYYLNSRNELFCQHTPAQPAVKVFTLPRNEQVSEMAVTAGGQLYYVNRRWELCTADISGGNLRNELLSRVHTLYHSKDRVTAMYLDGQTDGERVYLGVQDGLVVVSSDGRTDTIPAMSDKYIAAFRPSPDGRSLYMGTNNHGIVEAHGSRYTTVKGSKVVPFIRDVFVTGAPKPSLTVLTNHEVFAPNRKDTLSINGCSRLLPVADSMFYVLPEFGINKYVVRSGRMEAAGRYFGDIHFNPQASFQLHGRLYLVSEVGVLTMLPGHEEAPLYVTFDAHVLTPQHLFIAFGTLLTLSVLLLWMRLRRRSDRRKQLSRRIEDLAGRTRGMSEMADLLSSHEQEEINRLLKAVSAIRIDAPDVDAQISDLSEKIMYTNRDLALRLSKLLELQMQEISKLNAYDGLTLADESTTALAQGSVAQIGGQIMRNNEWLKQMAELNNRLIRYAETTENCLIVAGVNDRMKALTEQLRGSMPYRSLTEMTDDMAAAEEVYRHLFTPHALELLLAQIDLFQQRTIEVKGNAEPVKSSLLSAIERLRSEAAEMSRPALLQKLKFFEALVGEIEVRARLQEVMERYKAIREEVVKANEKRVNRKFDMQLEVEIGDYTTTESEEIEHLIASFYSLLTFTDAEVVNRVLNFTNFTHQQARVLALLIANPKEKRALLPGMLGMYGNLNPVISRLVNSKIKPNEAWLKAYLQTHTWSMAHYIESLI